MPESKEELEAGKEEIKRYSPPTPHQIKTRRKILQVENWIARNGLVEEDKVILYIMKAFDLHRPKALELYADVKRDFERLGRVYGK